MWIYDNWPGEHYTGASALCAITIRLPPAREKTSDDDEKSQIKIHIFNLGDLTETKKNLPLKILINKVAFSNGHILDLEEDAEEDDCKICKENTSWLWSRVLIHAGPHAADHLSIGADEWRCHFHPGRLSSSGETLCRDNCQLIGMPFFSYSLGRKK